MMILKNYLKGDNEYSRNAYNIIFESNPTATAHDRDPAEARLKATFTEPLIIPPLLLQKIGSIILVLDN
jgi:hypothetical protein